MLCLDKICNATKTYKELDDDACCPQCRVSPDDTADDALHELVVRNLQQNISNVIEALIETTKDMPEHGCWISNYDSVYDALHSVKLVFVPIKSLESYKHAQAKDIFDQYNKLNTEGGREIIWKVVIDAPLPQLEEHNEEEELDEDENHAMKYSGYLDSKTRNAKIFYHSYEACFILNVDQIRSQRLASVEKKNEKQRKENSNE